MLIDKKIHQWLKIINVIFCNPMVVMHVNIILILKTFHKLIITILANYVIFLIVCSVNREINLLLMSNVKPVWNTNIWLIIKKNATKLKI